MIRRLFSTQINSITIAALLVALSSVVSRFLGIFRDRILAGEFGAGDTLDIYYAAFRVPDLVFNLLVLGALSAGFIPIFIQLINKPSEKITGSFKTNRRESWNFANIVVNLLGLSLALISVLGIISAPYLVRLITPGFSPEKQFLAVSLTRIMFLSPVFLGISSIFGGIVQSYKRFFVYSLSPIFYNIGIIFGALYFVPIFGIKGLAWGVVLGALLHMIIQLSASLKLGYRYRPVFDYKNKHFKEVLRLMVPRTFSLAISQINLLVITIIASTLISGSLAIFNFANNLQSFPVGIFGISFAIAAFPTLSAIAFDRKKLIRSFSNIFRHILFFIMPATVLLLTLRAQIIRFVLGTGKFDWQDTVLTIDCLGYFAISLFAQASLPLLVRMFYARHNSKTPFFIGLASASVNLALSLYFSGKMGIAGLALAFSLANILNFALLWIWLRIEIKSLDELNILFSAVKISAAALLAGISIQGMKLLVWPYVDMTKAWGVFTQGAVSGLIGILVYLAFCSLLKSEEFYYFWHAFKTRLPWKKVHTGDQGEARGI